MVISIAVVCESPADQRTGCDLADRVVCTEVDWIDDDLLDHQRQWRGLQPNDSCLVWTAVKRLAKTSLIPLEGFGGETAAPDAHAARKALWLLHVHEHPPDAVVFLRDDDGDARRRIGLLQARAYSKFDTPVAIGVAHPKRECWVLAGFDPQNDEELSRLTELRKQLGFAPCQRAEELTASERDPKAKRKAKHVLDRLTDGDWERERECWRKTDLATLESRGGETGLADYLKEVREILVPVFRRQPSTS